MITRRELSITGAASLAATAVPLSADGQASAPGKTARSQVSGGLTMGAGAALMEELIVDQRFG